MQVTPFAPDGSLDLDSLASAVAWQAGLGISAISALGMAGEFYKLATDELERVVSAVVEAADGCATLVGVSAGSAEVAARLARHAERAGADALLVLPPYGVKPPVDGLVDYYAAIARAADLPIMVQDGSDELRAIVPFDVLVKLCRAVPAIAYVKVEDVAPAPKITALGEALGNDVTLLCGSGGLLILDAYDRGAVGCISGAATADLFVLLDNAYRAGDRDEAARLYRAYLPLLQLQCQSIELFVATEKRILARREKIAGETMRTPRYSLDERERELLDALYDEARRASARELAA